MQARKIEALTRMGLGANGSGENILEDQLTNFRQDYANEMEDEMNNEIDQVRIVSQTNLRLRRDNAYLNCESLEDRIRQKF